MTALVVFIAGLAAVVGVTAWVLMLLAGALHHSVHGAVPALGFWQSVLVVAVLSLVGGFFRGGKS